MRDRAPSGQFAATTAVVILTGVATVVVLPDLLGWFLAPVAMLLVGVAFHRWVTDGRQYAHPSILATAITRVLLVVAVIYVIVLFARAVVFVSNVPAEPPGYHGVPGKVSECTSWYPDSCPPLSTP